MQGRGLDTGHVPERPGLGGRVSNLPGGAGVCVSSLRPRRCPLGRRQSAQPSSSGLPGCAGSALEMEPPPSLGDLRRYFFTPEGHRGAGEACWHDLERRQSLVLRFSDEVVRNKRTIHWPVTSDAWIAETPDRGVYEVRLAGDDGVDVYDYIAALLLSAGDRVFTPGSLYLIKAYDELNAEVGRIWVALDRSIAIGSEAKGRPGDFRLSVNVMAIRRTGGLSLAEAVTPGARGSTSEQWVHLLLAASPGEPAEEEKDAKDDRTKQACRRSAEAMEVVADAGVLQGWQGPDNRGQRISGDAISLLKENSQGDWSSKRARASASPMSSTHQHPGSCDAQHTRFMAKGKLNYLGLGTGEHYAGMQIFRHMDLEVHLRQA